MRPAWMCLPPAVLAAFAGVIVTPADARAYSYKAHDYSECVTLALTDGRNIAGFWRGPLGSPSQPTDYESRYEAWRGPWGSYAAPALGETLLVSRKAGEPVSGAFRGFARGTLLLGTADSCAHLMVTLDQVEHVRRSADPSTDPEWTAARERWTSAPSLDGVALQSGMSTLAVPAAVIADDCTKPAAGGSAAGGVVLAVVAAGAIAYLVTAYTLGSFFHGLFGGLGRVGR